jgi:hypothetical protein
MERLDQNEDGLGVVKVSISGMNVVHTVRLRSIGETPTGDGREFVAVLIRVLGLVRVYSKSRWAGQRG